MNILLLEPNYKNKYPPLALMKLATFHKSRGDSVSFQKGENKELKDQKWDRIYITTLFTFEWKKVKDIISFSRKLVDSPRKIFIGSIAATLMPEFIRKQEPGIKVICGLLNRPGLLGLKNDHTIDELPPDYSILEQSSYEYPCSDAYFGYATRGCGMNCSFCAVQTLEPTYVPYISIVDQIKSIKELYGEKKNLMLMDNNVLKSPHFPEIIKDIIDLGFGKNATYINPITQKRNKRIVDFNQGLDANFLTPEKARLLAKIAIDPVRIAFDHINQKEKYLTAIKTCFDAGLRSFSNYILYNSDDNASWKGKEYEADTPENLYYRLLINLDLREELQSILDKSGIDEKVFIYSFPMRYIPLKDTSRGHVGTHWDKKSLRSIQIFLLPTQGKGVSSRSFFNASFGENIVEYRKNLAMPEELIYYRGNFSERKNESSQERASRYATFKLKKKAVEEWTNCYNKLMKEGAWSKFYDSFIECNTFRIETLNSISDPTYKLLYFFYLPFEYFKNHIKELSPESKNALSHFSTDVGPSYFSLFESYQK